MSIGAEHVKVAAGVTLVAITDTRRHAHARGHAVRGDATKRPLAIVIIDDGQFAIFDLSGNRITEADFRKNFPQASEKIEPLLKSKNTTAE